MLIQAVRQARVGMSQKGDTIVEVLIAIAVISLVMVGAYVTSNKNTSSTQDAQERNQAIKLVQSQIEYLRTATGSMAGKCYANGAAQVDNGSSVAPNACLVNAADNKATATEQPAYHLQLSQSGTTYTIKATWIGLLDSSNQNVTVYYRP